MKPSIWVDFQKSDVLDRLPFVCIGTISSIHGQGVELFEGMEIMLYQDDVDADDSAGYLMVDGIARWDGRRKYWAAELNWSAIHFVKGDMFDAEERLRKAAQDTLYPYPTSKST